jgi:hypothetical protein
MQVLANFLSTPLASGLDGDALGLPYVAFDLDLSIVKVSVICQIQKTLVNLTQLNDFISPRKTLLMYLNFQKIRYLQI